MICLWWLGLARQYPYAKIEGTRNKNIENVMLVGLANHTQNKCMDGSTHYKIKVAKTSECTSLGHLDSVVCSEPSTHLCAFCWFANLINITFSMILFLVCQCLCYGTSQGEGDEGCIPWSFKLTLQASLSLHQISCTLRTGTSIEIAASALCSRLCMKLMIRPPEVT